MPMPTYIICGSELAGYEMRMAGLKFKQHRNDRLRAENGWLDILSSSEMAGYELRTAGLKF
jgi:hypothetical protein